MNYKKEWRKNNPEKYKKHRKTYNEKHKEEIKIRRKSIRERNKKKPECRYKTYVHSARQRKHDFNLSFEEFMTFWQKPCSYCGDKIENIGLDRIDSGKGYTLDNIESCCWACNKMKLNYTREEFFNHCKKIITFRYQNSIRA